MFLCAAAQAGSTLGPYLQQPAPDSITICWETEDPEMGAVEVTKDNGVVATVTDERPVKDHALTIKGLQPGTKYLYRIGNRTALGKPFNFSTAPTRDSAIRFAMFGDPQLDANTGVQPFELLKQVCEKHPDFLLIAGDLVQTGGNQNDWALFWNTFTSGQAYYLAQNIPIIPALGNHDYWSGGRTGYSAQNTERSVASFKKYFKTPANHAQNQEYEGRYYSFTYGPATFIVLDSINDDAGDAFDTNKMLTGGNSPGLNPQSEQYRWLEQSLEKAQRESEFIFVMFHHAPFSAGSHGNPDDVQSGYPLRRLDPLFHKYRVTAVLNGHDHINQRVHTVGDDGRELLYITATANPPRDVEPKADTWLDGDPRIKRLFFSNKERCFLLATITHENAVWRAKLEFVGASGKIYDALDIAKERNGAAGLAKTRLTAGPMVEAGVFITLTVAAWLVFRPRERNAR